MHVSLNEFQATAAKAAVGAGLPSGLAASVAAAAGWLAVRRLPGLQVLLAASDPAFTDGDLPAPAECRAGLWVFPDARAVVAGPSAVDLMLADPTVEVLLDRLDVPLLIVGLAGAALAGAGAHLQGIAVGFEGGGTARVSARAVLTDRAVPASARTLTLRRCTLLENEPSTGLPSQGVEIDRCVWQQAQTLAARTYVPEDPLSRARGAGAGAIDNE